MITTVTSKNMVSVPAAIGRQLGITPGYRLDWHLADPAENTLTVRVIPDRKTMSERLFGSGKRFSPKRDLVAELIKEREAEDCE